MAEWQQAKRLDLDPREVKQIFQGAWQQSDSMPAFKAALEEHGYYLAKGDRRGFVATDIHHEVYSISRWTGVKAKEIKERLGDPERLPGVGEVQKSLDARLTGKIRERLVESRAEQAQERAEQALALREMVQAHRQERARLEHKLDERSKAEAKERAARLHTGIRGVWELLTGKARAIRRQNEREAYDGFVRDRTLREELFATQAKEKKKLRKGVSNLRTRHREERMRLSGHIADILHLNQEQDRTHEHMRERFQAMSFGMG